MRIFLLELRVYDGSLAAPSIRVLRYATGIGYTTKSGDLLPGPESGAPPSWYTNGAGFVYVPRVTQLPRMAIATQNGIAQGTGELILANGDFGLDALSGYTFDGRDVLLYVGDDTQALSTFKLLLSATMGEPTFDATTVTVPFRTNLRGLDQVFQPALFGGTGGLDGTSDLAGKTKPRILQYAANFAPPCVDPTNLIYQLSVDADPAGSILAVYDSGVLLTTTFPVYPDVATLLSTAPAAGHVRLLPGANAGGQGSFIRLGSVPQGQITVELQNDIAFAWKDYAETKILAKTTLGSSWTVPDTIAVRCPGMSANFQQYMNGGLYVDSPLTALEVWARWLASARGWIVPLLPSSGWTRPFGFRFLDDPSVIPDNSWRPSYTNVSGANPVLVLPGDGVVSMQRITPSDDAFRGLPRWRETLAYGHNETVQASGLAAGATMARRTHIGEEWQNQAAADASVQTAYPLAGDETIDTTYSFSALDSGATSTINLITGEATRLLTAVKPRREWFELVGRIDTLLAAQLVVGDPMTVAGYPRFGCTVSRRFLILGAEIDWDGDSGGAGSLATLTVWG